MTAHRLRGLARRLGLALLATSALASCSAGERRAQVRGQIAAILDRGPDAPALRAAASRVEAGLARENEAAVLDDLELRVQNVSPSAVQYQGQGYDLEARLAVHNPWEALSERRARQAETDAAVAELEERSLELRAESCTRDVEAAAYQERLALLGWYEERLGQLLLWAADCRAAGALDELEAQRLSLQAAESLESRRPRFVDTSREPARPAASLAALPPLPGAEAPLDSRSETILAILRDHQPEADSRRATARAYEAFSERATRRGLPWLGFVGVSWEADPNSTAADLAGEVSVEIPLSFDWRAESSRYQALGQAEQDEAAALVDEAAQRVRQALGQIVSFEEAGARLLALLDRAAQAETIAERWRSEHLGDPSRIARLLEDILDARDTVVEAREQAGLAGCALLEATGLAASQWPRRDGE